MKKRLRKKRRLGEFREDCFELEFRIDSALQLDGVYSLIDDFIELIESRSLRSVAAGATTLAAS